VAQANAAAPPAGTGHGAADGAPEARSRRATTVAWALVLVLALAGAVLTVMASGSLTASDTIANFGAAPAAVLYATLGALVVRRAGHVIGWLLLGEGAAAAILAAASAYAVLGITQRGTLPAPELVALLAEWSVVPVFVVLGFMLIPQMQIVFIWPAKHLAALVYDGFGQPWIAQAIIR